MDVSKVPFLGLAQYTSQINQQSGLAPSQRITSLEKTQGTLAEKYGTGSIDLTFIPVAREQFRNGLSPMPFGALGENAIIQGNARVGRDLNIMA